MLRSLGVATVIAATTGGRLVAQRNDSTAVIAAAQASLHAISTSDSAAARRVMLPGAWLMGVSDPENPAMSPIPSSAEGFFQRLGAGKEKLTERMWAPTAVLHGTLAEVHAPYDFHIDGKFSHCGTDVFTLVRAKGEWRIVSIVYTVQRTGCAPSPLGPIAR
jgi:hypothetical protein